MGTNLGDLLRTAGLKPSEAPPPEETTAGPPVPEEEGPLGTKLVVRRTKKGRGGKTVTVVTGITGKLEVIAKRLRKELGVGSRVEDDALVLQGDQVERVARWFESQGVKKVVRS